MQDRLAELESRLEAVERRLSALETTSSAETAVEQTAPDASLGEGFVGSASIHIGRVLLIFGGAYLLRAVTESEYVPTGIGIAMGAGYALLWLLMGHRTAQVEQQRASAAFYAGTSVLLALPLVVEAVTKFNLLSGAQGALALAAYFALALAVAVVRDLRSLAWLVTAGAIGSGFAVLIAARAPVAIVSLLLLVGLGSLWAVYVRQWPGLQWLGALGATAGTLVMLVLAGNEQWALRPALAVVYAAALLISYFTSFAIRSHVLGKDLGLFEGAQSAVAAGVALWAATAVAGAGHASLLSTIGISGLGLAASAYALALAPATRSVRGKNFFYYLTVGLVFLVAGSALVLPSTAAAVLWSLTALIMAWLSGRTGWVILSLQCTVLLLAAGATSGLLATGLFAFAGDPSAPWPAAVPWHPGLALTTVACLFIPVAQHSPRWGKLAGLPQLTVLALSIWEVGGLMVAYSAPLLADVLADPNLAALAALRTIVLAVSSVTLALSSRFRRWPEARWLVYPVLILVGIKLFVEDFPNGQPASLFVALVFVGGALLLVARLLSRDELSVRVRSSRNN